MNQHRHKFIIARFIKLISIGIYNNKKTTTSEHVSMCLCLCALRNAMDCSVIPYFDLNSVRNGYMRLHRDMETVN